MYSYIVYVDEVLLGNIIVNLAILWATGRLARVETVKWRFFSGAALGALYSFILFIPVPAYLYSAVFKILASVIIVLFVFGTMPVKKFLVTLGYFYFTSFAMGGIVFGAGYFLSSYTGFETGEESFLRAAKDYFWYGILLAIAAVYMLAKWSPVFWRRRVSEEVYYFPLTINFGGKTAAVNSFLDTGNHLSDPLTGYPVVVVEYDAVKHVFPEGIREAIGAQLQNEDDLTAILKALADSEWSVRFRVIPFHAVGNTNGLLFGFCPDEINIKCKEKTITLSKVIIGIYHKPLSPESTYRALLHPQLFNNSN